MSMSEVSQRADNMSVGEQATMLDNFSRVVPNSDQIDSEPQQINLAAIPCYAPSTILDLGEDHFYSMAHEFLVPTNNPRSEIARLQREVHWYRKNGKCDTAKELQLLYHQRVEGMADFTYLPILGLTIKDAYDRWHMRGRWRNTTVDLVEKTRSRLHISAMLCELTSEMSSETVVSFLCRSVLASLTANDRAQVLVDLATYMGSQYQH